MSHSILELMPRIIEMGGDVPDDSMSVVEMRLALLDQQ